MKDETIKNPHPLKDYKDIKYHNIGMTGSFTSMERDNIKSLSVLYFDIVNNCQKEFKEIFDILTNNTSDTIYLNCSAGKDRTGVLVYLIFDICGVSKKDIVENYSESYENNKKVPTYGTLPESYYRFMTSNKSEMESFINDMNEKYGNAYNYLLEIGVTNEQINKIRLNLLGGNFNEN